MVLGKLSFECCPPQNWGEVISVISSHHASTMSVKSYQFRGQKKLSRLAFGIDMMEVRLFVGRCFEDGTNAVKKFPKRQP
jgi:hypothetical protein